MYSLYSSMPLSYSPWFSSCFFSSSPSLLSFDFFLSSFSFCFYFLFASPAVCCNPEPSSAINAVKLSFQDCLFSFVMPMTLRNCLNLSFFFSTSCYCYSFSSSVSFAFLLVSFPFCIVYAELPLEYFDQGLDN